MWIFFLIYWIVSARGIKRNLRPAPLWSGVLLRVVILTIVLLAVRSPLGTLLRSTFGRNLIVPPPATAIAGVVVCAAGVALAVWARHSLGANWGLPMSVKENGELVTTGPYALVRHPIYSGILFGLLGTALAEGLTWIIVFLVAAPYVIISARVEERVLAQEFPNDYPPYRRRTKLLIPYLL